jgi:hypothetical protein
MAWVAGTLSANSATTSRPASDAVTAKEVLRALVQWRLRRYWKHSGDTYRQPGRTLLKDHHEDYINWAEFERNQRQLVANACARIGGGESVHGGRTLLTGVLTSERCARRVSIV